MTESYFIYALAEYYWAKGDKAGYWTCPYHNGRMCMEVIERVK